MENAGAEQVSRGVVSASRLGPLIEYASPTRPLYMRHGDVEIVGIGEHARWTASGPNRFGDLSSRWNAFTRTVDRDLRSDLVALGSGMFDPNGVATLVIPRVTIIRRGREATTVVIGDLSSVGPPARRSIGASPVVEWPNIDSVFPDRVRTALARLDDEFVKVVVARALTGRIDTPGDERAPLVKLAREYPDCHIVAADGLWGASPETLVAVRDRRVTARVLAGSAARGGDPQSDGRVAEALLASAKDRDEHAYAAQSVVSALRPFCRSIVGAAVPFTLRLSNLWHLASDITGVLASHRSVLDLIDALHPTAAVAGVPRDRALDTIRDIEAIPRDRYAGPIGWVDGDGNGEWAIALRCAQWGEGSIVAHAGAGVVAGSVPDSEFAETELKFRPIRDALAN